MSGNAIGVAEARTPSDVASTLWSTHTEHRSIGRHLESRLWLGPRAVSGRMEILSYAEDLCGGCALASAAKNESKTTKLFCCGAYLRQGAGRRAQNAGRPAESTSELRGHQMVRGVGWSARANRSCCCFYAAAAAVVAAHCVRHQCFCKKPSSLGDGLSYASRSAAPPAHIHVHASTSAHAGSTSEGRGCSVEASRPGPAPLWSAACNECHGTKRPTRHGRAKPCHSWAVALFCAALLFRRAVGAVGTSVGT